MTRYVFSYFIRQGLLLGSLLLLKKFFPERIVYPERLKAIGIIMALAITAAMLIEEFGAHIIFEKKYDKSYSLLLRAALTELALFCLVFFAAFLAIKHYAKMPVSMIPLILLSLATGFCHQMISFFFGWSREKLMLIGLLYDDDESIDDDYFEL